MKIDQMKPWFDEKEINAVVEYMKNGGWLTDFRKTRELEKVVRDYTGSKYCSVVNNGTTALQIALMAMGIGKDDTVLCPAYSHPASAYSASLCGAKVVFVDVEKDTFNISTEKLWYALEKTKASCIIHVSINGRSVPIGEIVKFYKDNTLILTDDAQSLGSKYNGKHLGTFGDVGMLSFNTFKLISCGQSAALITDNEEIYNKIIRIKDFGRAGGRGSQYEMLGMNAKANDLLSTIMLEQFKKLDWRVAHKKSMFKWYMDNLKDIEQVRFIPTNLDDCSPWFIDPLVEKRDELIKYLAENDIETQPFYPPLHRLPYYEYYNNQSFPNTEYISEHGIWLPSSSFLDKPTIDMICEKIVEFYKK